MVITVQCVNKEIQDGLFRIFREGKKFTFISCRGQYPITSVSMLSAQIIRLETSNDERIFFITTGTNHSHTYVYAVSEKDFPLVRSFLKV